MKGSGGHKKAPPSTSPGRKNPPVPKINPPRSTSGPREKRCSSPVGKCRPARSPTNSKKNICKTPTQTVRKQLSPTRGASTTKKLVANAGKSKKTPKKVKPSPPEKLTQTTSSLINHDKIAVIGSILDTARELEHILLTDARSEERSNLVTATSSDSRTEPELKLDQSEEMQCVGSTMVPEANKNIHSIENESTSVYECTYKVKAEGEFEVPPPTKEITEDKTLDMHIASLRNLINAKNLHHEKYSIVSQLQGSSVISTAEGHVTISTGDKHITISSVEGRGKAVSDGVDSLDQSNVSSEGSSTYSEYATEPKLVISNHMGSNVSTIIIESQGRCYSNNDEETRARIASNDPHHPFARRTISSPARSEDPAIQPQPTSTVNAPRTPVADSDIANKPATVGTLPSSVKENVPPETHSVKQPENTASDVSKFVLVVDLNKSVTNPDGTNSVKSKYAVTSVRSQFESGADLRRPCKEEKEGEEERAKSQNNNKRVVKETASYVKSNQNSHYSLKSDESLSKKYTKSPTPSQSRTCPAFSHISNVARPLYKKGVSEVIISKTQSSSEHPLRETYSIKEYDHYENETDKRSTSPSKVKFRDSKDMGDQTNKKHMYNVCEVRENKSRQEYTPKTIGWVAAAKNNVSSIETPTESRSTSPTETREYKRATSKDSYICSENKENETQNSYPVVCDSTKSKVSKMFDKIPFTKQLNTFSINDILAPAMEENVKTLGHTNTSPKSSRIEINNSTKTIQSYVTVKESNSRSLVEIDVNKKKKQSNGEIAQRL